MWPVLLSKTQITGDFSCAAGCLVPVQVELEADAVATLLVWTRSPALTSANDRWEERKREKQPALPPKYRHIWNNSYDTPCTGKPATPTELLFGQDTLRTSGGAGLVWGEGGKMVFKQSKGNLKGCKGGIWTPS